MRNHSKMLLASTAVIVAGGLSVQASAQVLVPGEPVAEVISTTETVTFDPETEVTTAVTAVEEAVAVNYTTSNSAVFGPFGGQIVSGAYAFDASVGFNQVTETTVTATPDGLGGFVVSETVTGEPEVTSEIAVQSISGSQQISTPITGLLLETYEITSSTGATANVEVEQGVISADPNIGIFLSTNTATSTFDPVTGELSDPVVDAESVEFVNITSAGLTTNGTVTAETVIADDVTLGGESLVGTLAGLDAADVALGARIDDETAARVAAVADLEAADAALGARIDDETAARIAAVADLEAADAALGARIDDETAARIAAVADLEAADLALGVRIDGEAAARVAADTVLDGRITTESTARVAADTALGNRITAETNARTAADLAEANARIAADNALSARITAETDARIAADNVLRDQIASSTATAIALGGNAILPDSNFTLSGNVGFYQGASAVSINAAGRVSEKVYLTGALGGGLNKRGKLGGRVGVVFGF